NVAEKKIDAAGISPYLHHTCIIYPIVFQETCETKYAMKSNNILKASRKRSQYYVIIYKYLARITALILGFVSVIAFTLTIIRFSGLSLSQALIFKNNDFKNLHPGILMESESISLCVLIRVHRGHLPYLPVLALALSHTGFRKINLYVINIDKAIDHQLLSHTINIVNKIVLRENYITLLDVGIPKTDDFGFTLTDCALTYLYKRYEKFPAECQYIILTNADNFYSQDLGKNVVPHMVAKKDIIAWDFVSRYYRPEFIHVNPNKNQAEPLIIDAGTAKCIPVKFRIGYADLGAVAYRLAFLKQHRLHIHYPNGTYNNLSDGFFVETAANLTNSSAILRQTLYIHQ
ncbi:unnamed protein product, partial [Rotaria socialis]